MPAENKLLQREETVKVPRVDIVLLVSAKQAVACTNGKYRNEVTECVRVCMCVVSVCVYVWCVCVCVCVCRVCVCENVKTEG